MTIAFPTENAVTEPNPQALALPDVAARMADAGMAPDTIANILDIPAITVRQALVTHTRLTPEDAALASKTRTLISRCIDEAHFIIDTGSNADRISIVRSVLPIAARLMGKEEDTVTAGQKVFEELFAEMRVNTNVLDAETAIPEDA